MLSTRLGAGALAATVAWGGLDAAGAQETLRALSMLPKPVTYTQNFLEFIDEVNEAGHGVVRIEFIGGPEAIPTFDQPEAVRTGVIDIVYAPGSYYPGLVPETDALVGANVSPMEQRARVGTWIDEQWQAVDRSLIRRTSGNGSSQATMERRRAGASPWSAAACSRGKRACPSGP